MCRFLPVSTGASLAALGAALLVLVIPAAEGRAVAAELLMLERDGCVWCERWHEEIGPIYPRTAEAAIAPLRRVDIDGPWPNDLASVRPDRFTPTFILIENGVEIDRLRGYPGDGFFWFLIGEMLDRLPREPGNSG